MGVADAGRPAKPGAGSPETLLNFWRYLGFEGETLANGDTIGGSAAERIAALREHELFPYAMWGLVAFAAVAVAALVSALSSERANSAKAPIELTQLRTSAPDVARLQETIDKLLLEQQRLARRVEEFERTQSDLTATTPVDRKNVAWGPPPYPFGLKVKQKGTAMAEVRERPLPIEVREPVPVPPAPIPAETPAEKEATAPVPPVAPVPPAPTRAAVPLPPLPPLEKETTVVPPAIAERDTLLQLPPPLTEKDVGLMQLPAARVTETPRIMETPRGAEPLRTTETPRPVEAPRPPEPSRAAETPRPPEAPRAVETPRPPETPRAVAPRAVETARVEIPRVAEKPLSETTQAIVTRTEFALDLGGEMTLDGLRARWASLRGNHGQALDNLKPLVALREADQPGAFDFRLLVGPIANAADAARICARLNTTKIICAVTPFDGQHLALR